MATVGGEGSLFFLLLCVHLCMTTVNCGYTFNMDKCRSCSSSKEVPCYMQHIPYSCFPGHTQDTFTDFNEWPGAARNLSAKVDVRGGNLVANFTWKPPYDCSFSANQNSVLAGVTQILRLTSSVKSLRGFEIQLTILEVSSMSFTLCFFANITNRNWTNSDQRHNVVFHLDCIESSEPAQINAFVTSIPKPLRNHQRQQTSVTLVGIKHEWLPNIFAHSICTSHNSTSVFIWFDVPYPQALYHEFHLMESSSVLVNISFLKMPSQNISFYNVQCNKNYSIWVRPLSSSKKQLTDHFVSKSFAVQDCSEPVKKPIVTAVDTGFKEVIAVICIPILLLIVAIVTVLCYCKRDQIKLMALTILRSDIYRQAASTDAPNNVGQESEKNYVIPIYHQNDGNIDEVVHRLRNLLQGVKGSKIEFITGEAVMESHKKHAVRGLVLLSKGILEYYEKGKNQEAGQNGRNMNSSIDQKVQLVKACKNAQPFVYLSLLPNVNTAMVRDLIPGFVESHCYTLLEESESGEYMLSEQEIKKLIQEFHAEETLQLEDLLRISSMKETIELQKTLSDFLQGLIWGQLQNGDVPFCSAASVNNASQSSNHCSYIPTDRQEVTFVNDVQNGFSKTVDFRNMYYDPIDPVQNSHCTSVCHVHKNMPNCYHDNTYMYSDKRDAICHSRKGRIERNKMSTESGYKSLDADEGERVPFMSDPRRVQPNDFVSPHESDIESLDAECASLSDKMLDINQRNSPMWYKST